MRREGAVGAYAVRRLSQDALPSRYAATARDIDLDTFVGLALGMRGALRSAADALMTG